MIETADELVAAARAADGPSIPISPRPDLGGVDPLGLRQLNFNLMDEVLPGLNNVARHVRPFVVVAWASRQARRIAKSSGRLQVSEDELRDFVDRVEVVYAWSQFLRNRNADLPGRQVLGKLVAASDYRFGGAAWKKRRATRRYSTAFTAAVNYGPALKALRWMSADPEHPSLLCANEAVSPALDAFEAAIAAHLDHPVFSRLGDVSVTAADVKSWSKSWALEKVSRAEQRVCADLLRGDLAPATRRDSLALILAAARELSTVETEDIRIALARALPTFVPAGADAAVKGWRRLQVRQLFRLALESLLYWIIWALEYGPMSTGELVTMFMDECDGWPNGDGDAPWLDAPDEQDPIALMREIQSASSAVDGESLATAIAAALAFCLTEPVSSGLSRDAENRLPLSRAVREANAWSRASVPAFLAHVIEAWVLAQHVYWSVGRGLSDARGNRGRLMRLKVVLDEGGWALAPGVKRGNPPYPTPDRLHTAISLALQCGLLKNTRS